MLQSGIVALSATTCIKVIETQWGLLKNIYLAASSQLQHA